MKQKLAQDDQAHSKPLILLFFKLYLRKEDMTLSKILYLANISTQVYDHTERESDTAGRNIMINNFRRDILEFKFRCNINLFK
jgi:hypothetical protein